MARHRLARTAIRTLTKRIRVGHVGITWSDGAVTTVGAPGGPEASVDIHDEGMIARALLNEGGVGLGAAYLDGAWDSPDLSGFLEILSMNVDARLSTSGGSRLAATARSFWDRRPSFARSDAIGQIGDHYDLGNHFYAWWLDPTMSYSSAIFDDLAEPLEAAQERKYRRLCEMLDLQPGDRILEIGCGWGGFSEYAAVNYDVSVTGLTLSSEMAIYARKRAADAGIADRVDIKLQDFRDERAMYDKVVSIEMIESVDESVWPPLFNAIARALPPGGKAAMQAITIEDAFYENLLRREDFIKRYIFPGGALPTVSVLKQLTESAGMEWVSHAMHGLDYAETLARWSESFEEAWPSIVGEDGTFDERFRRMWRYYLEYCEAGFRVGRLDGIQMLIERPSA